MANIYDTLKSYITSDMISKAGKELGQNDTQISQAIRTAIPTLLASFLHRGNSKKVQNILQDADRKNVLTDKEKLFEAYPEAEKISVGENFVSAVMGEKETTLHSLLAGDQVMSNTNTKKLLAMVGTLVAGLLGKRLSQNGGDMSKLLDEVEGERDEIMAAIPQDWKEKLGIPMARKSYTVAKDEKKPKKKNGWIWWVIIILAILLLIWLMRGCKSCNRERVTETTTVVTTRVDSSAMRTNTRETYELSLPNGQSLTVYRGGLEDQMIRFLESDAYKNGTDMQMRDHWFEFDDIEFEFNSGTQLMGNSKRQVDNIAAILKHYTDAKIRIGGFADKKGGEQVNMAISEERANTIKRMLGEAGIAASRISTEGFGEEYATIPASASDEQRAPDRDIALRFMK